MRRWSVLLVFVICAIWLFGEAKTSARTASSLHYDRIELLARFLQTVYPGLANNHQLAMLEVDVLFEPNLGARISHLQLYPCSSDAEMPGPEVNRYPGLSLPSKPTAPAPPKSSATPLCGTDPTPESKKYLQVTVEITNHQKHPIAKFASSGTYVDTKLRELRQQFAGKWYPDHDEVLKALRSMNPKYGPDNRKEFLATLPTENIRDLTGCRLRPETATFVAELSENTLHQLPDFQWHLEGRAAGSKVLGTCSAAFEPFDGHLTLFMD